MTDYPSQSAFFVVQLSWGRILGGEPTTLRLRWKHGGRSAEV